MENEISKACIARENVCENSFLEFKHRKRDASPNIKNGAISINTMGTIL